MLHVYSCASIACPCRSHHKKYRHSSTDVYVVLDTKSTAARKTSVLAGGFPLQYAEFDPVGESPLAVCLRVCARARLCQSDNDLPIVRSYGCSASSGRSPLNCVPLLTAGHVIAYVFANNLYTHNLATGQTHAVTTDGLVSYSISRHSLAAGFLWPGV